MAIAALGFGDGGDDLVDLGVVHLRWVYTRNWERGGTGTRREVGGRGCVRRGGGLGGRWRLRVVVVVELEVGRSCFWRGGGRGRGRDRGRARCWRLRVTLLEKAWKRRARAWVSRPGPWSARRISTWSSARSTVQVDGAVGGVGGVFAGVVDEIEEDLLDGEEVGAIGASRAAGATVTVNVMPACAARSARRGRQAVEEAGQRGGFDAGVALGSFEARIEQHVIDEMARGGWTSARRVLW